MTEEVTDGLGLAKKLIFNRRYKVWIRWFYALVGVALFCAYLDRIPLFEAYAMWSTVGLVAIIGGLSSTDFIKIKNGVGK